MSPLKVPYKKLHCSEIKKTILKIYKCIQIIVLCTSSMFIKSAQCAYNLNSSTYIIYICDELIKSIVNIPLMICVTWYKYYNVIYYYVNLRVLSMLNTYIVYFKTFHKMLHMHHSNIFVKLFKTTYSYEIIFTLSLLLNKNTCRDHYIDTNYIIKPNFWEIKYKYLSAIIIF